DNAAGNRGHRITAGYVGLWHRAGKPDPQSSVSFSSKSRPVMLNLSLSGHDPTRKWCVHRVRRALTDRFAHMPSGAADSRLAPAARWRNRRQRSFMVRREAMEFLGTWPHSGLMLAPRITLPHFSVSSAMSLTKSEGEPGITVPPKSAILALILGSARPALISLLSVLMTCEEVLRGAPIPVNALDS